MEKPALRGMRRSCEPCRRRRKKCDGERPCSLCLRFRDECTYSKRRRRPQEQQQRKEQHQQQQQPHPHVIHPGQVQQPSASGAVLGYHGMLPFRRCTLSASPATGLVGMQENGFLVDFFGCVGFLPLTTQSHIREAMVKIMLNSASRQKSASMDDRGEVGQSNAVVCRGEFGHAFGGEELPMGPSICIFWCAVGLGALAKGSPIESVARYLQLATEALANRYAGPADAEVARAWAILGYLYSFMDDEAKFKEYLALSDTFLTTSIEQGSTDALPLGFAEIIQHREIGEKSYRKMESICSREQAPPQLARGASEHELYRFAMQSIRAFEQAVFTKILSQSVESHDPFGDDAEQPAGKVAGEQPHVNGVPQSQEVSEATASVWTEYNIDSFGPLEEAVDRPSIRAGLGGIFINGSLVFEAACKGDVCNTLMRIGRCVEVFERYPGLCRSIIGTHWAHIMSAALAALDDSGAREVYDTLRGVYNPFRPLGSSPLPPLEEWQGLSAICKDAHCRAIEGVIASGKMKAFSTSTDRSAPCEIVDDKGEKPLGLAGQKMSPLVVACITPGEESVIPTPSCPGSSGGGPQPSSFACESSGELSPVVCGGSEQWFEPTAAPTPPTASGAYAVHPHRCKSESKLDEERCARSDTDVGQGRKDNLAGGGVIASHDARFVMPPGLSEGAMEDVEDDVAAADWLGDTLALLDEGD